MSKHNVIELKQPVKTIVDDPLTDLIRKGAREILKQALDLEVESFLQQYKSLKTEEGRQRMIRNGYLPEREITTGIGKVSVQVPRVRDKQPPEKEEPIRFQSSLVPPYLRKSKSMEALIPYLYLKGISTGDMGKALEALVGPNAKGFSPGVVTELKKQWMKEYQEWKHRDLTKSRYLYIWVDGIHSHVRMDDKQCMLVVIGVRAEGQKELLAVEGGFRESTQSWREVLLDLQHRGLRVDPELAVGDGALGFWSALSEVFPDTRFQRCWVHKTANILDKLPKTAQTKAKKQIHEIWMAETKEQAKAQFDLFAKTYWAKYPKAVETLVKDQESLLTFYDFPAEHWKHIRTTNPIESTFATVRLRTAKARNCFSSETVLTMTFKLCKEAEKTWRKLSGSEHLAKIIKGVRFIDGEEELKKAA